MAYFELDQGVIFYLEIQLEEITNFRLAKDLAVVNTTDLSQSRRRADYCKQCSQICRNLGEGQMIVSSVARSIAI